MQEYRKLQERTNEDLVIEYQTTHNEDLFRALLEKNTGLLHIIVMDYRIPKYEIEDLLSESYIALIKAVDNFDPTRGVTFTTALKVFVRQHLNRLYNEVTCQKRYNGMDPASYEELVEIHKDDVRGLDCDRFTQIEVDEYLEGLESKDRYMVKNTDRAKGVCRAGGGKAGDSETSTTGSTAFSDRITGYLQQKAGFYRSSGVQEVGGMSEPRVRYEDNLYHYALQQEIASLERHIHHDIDNWEMDMSKELLDELKDLEKKCRSVNQRMKKDIARNS